MHKSVSSKSQSYGLIAVLVGGMTLLAHSPAQAFDGDRQGFVLGFGLGGGFTSAKSEISALGQTVKGDRQNEGSVASDFKIGYGISEDLLLYWSSRVSWMRVDDGKGDNIVVTHGTGGVGATYFVTPDVPFYVVGSLGFALWDAPLEENVDALWGLGGSAGVGYEFAPHWSAEIAATYGHPSDKYEGFELITKALSVLATINLLAY